eukprot:COSAG02_NODE_1322_length_13259_cov_71.269985_13_plen_58_part_00
MPCSCWLVTLGSGSLFRSAAKAMSSCADNMCKVMLLFSEPQGRGEGKPDARHDPAAA